MKFFYALAALMASAVMATPIPCENDVQARSAQDSSNPLDPVLGPLKWGLVPPKKGDDQAPDMPAQLDGNEKRAIPDMKSGPGKDLVGQALSTVTGALKGSKVNTPAGGNGQ
ncbi:predicted protein [Uncinocarpus reesii 1704]|uniref:Uncharacterized protein n=1 Tax=Uncinocarpus reesii (strain UAMH 1704) TaxID=336963 RepID=C4JZF2_UNCRE|nr:uncharacterized protein UREG_07553 [Uncinocarpus reesii 1704]EEP82688.1 predicted protein [Uncinocarpus reesii 1704]